MLTWEGLFRSIRNKCSMELSYFVLLLNDRLFSARDVVLIFKIFLWSLLRCVQGIGGRSVWLSSKFLYKSYSLS